LLREKQEVMKQMNRTYVVIGVIAVIVCATVFALPIAAKPKPRIQRFTVKITERGFEPVSLTLRRGVQARITFLRTTDQTCAKEIVLRDFGIRQDLPLNQPVVVTLTPKTKGEFSFTCGMNMMRGKLTVQ
jgi:plastocyanin domain-containing protein